MFWLTHQLLKRYLDLIEQQVVCHIPHLQLHILVDEAELEGEADSFGHDARLRRFRAVAQLRVAGGGSGILQPVIGHG